MRAVGPTTEIAAAGRRPVWSRHQHRGRHRRIAGGELLAGTDPAGRPGGPQHAVQALGVRDRERGVLAARDGQRVLHDALVERGEHPARAGRVARHPAQHLAAQLEAEPGIAAVPVDVDHVPGHRHGELHHLGQLILQLDEQQPGHVADRGPLGRQQAELEHPQAQPVPAAPGPLQQTPDGQRGQHPAGRALGHAELAGHLGGSEYGMRREAVEHGGRDRHRPQPRRVLGDLSRGRERGHRGQSHTGISSGGGTFTSVTRLR